MQKFPIEAYIDLDHPSDVQLAPDGSQVAFVYGKGYKPDAEHAPEKALYVVDTATREKRLLASGGTNDQPRWSPDSTKLAFVSNRDNPQEGQLYVIDPRGGEAKALTNVRGVVDTPLWSPDSCWISFRYHGTLDAEEQPEPDPIVVDSQPPFKQIWRVNVETGEILPVTPDDTHAFEYAWSPDGSQIAVLSSSHPNPDESWYSAQLHIVAVNTGKLHQVCQIKDQMGRITWSPDGNSLAFVSGIMSDEGNVAGEIYTVPAAGGTPQSITPDTTDSITAIEWRDDGIFYGARSVDSTVFAVVDPESTELRGISKGKYGVNGYGAQRISIADNGTFAALRSSFTEPTNIYTGSIANGDWNALTNFEIDKAAFPPLNVENRYWKHPDGTPVHGFLYYPPDYQPGKRYPLFLHVHGGPSWGYVPHYLTVWERLMVARGCIVLSPNPRGSWGYGHAYQSANVGDLGGGDWQDINAGVDALIDAGLVDPEHMAIGGWSYGGYLVTWAVTQTTRFRCAIAGASITSYESNYGVVDNREWQTTMFGSNVYDDYELHRSRSPMQFVKQVKTPTLLVHGMVDNVAPPQQAIEFYTALKHFGVPAQLVLYPREPHGFRERAHQIDLYQRIGAWVDKYMFD